MIQKYRVYVWIDGVEFDPDMFNKNLSSSLQGIVAIRKQMKNGVVETAGKYWKSKVLHTSGDPIECLNKALIQLKPCIISLGKKNTIRIVAEIVAQYTDSIQISGFFISRETIELLHEMGASLDIDQYAS